MATTRTSHQHSRGQPILGTHPVPPHLFGRCYSSQDEITARKVPHRSLIEIASERSVAVTEIRGMLVRHHQDASAYERSSRVRTALDSLGMSLPARLSRLPGNPDTRKGNLAEVLLAEYLVACSPLQLPVYRLRYNPNVEQSMKGDDVLAFDLDSDPVRVVVGEAKFRGTPSKAAVEEIVLSLERSHSGGVPASLQFVADRLFDAGNRELGEKVLTCAILFVERRLRLEYVGLLLGDSNAANMVGRHATGALRRLAMISMNIDRPNDFAQDCYENLE